MTRIRRIALGLTLVGATILNIGILAVNTSTIRPVTAHSEPTECLADAEGNCLYITVRRYEGVTDPAEAGRRVQEGFIPIIREVPGFVAYYWADAGNGVMISTSVFTDPDGPAESDRRASDFVVTDLRPLLPNPPQITHGPVVATHAVE